MRVSRSMKLIFRFFYTSIAYGRKKGNGKRTGEREYCRGMRRNIGKGGKVETWEKGRMSIEVHGGNI